MNIILLLAICVFLISDNYIQKREKYIFLGCLTGAVLLNLQTIADIYVHRPENMHMLGFRTFIGFAGYVLRPMLLWGLWEDLRGVRKQLIRKIMIVLVGVNTLVFFTSFFTDWTFGFDPVTYSWYRGPLGMTAHIVMGMMMILFVPTLFDIYLHNKKKDFFIGVCALLIIVVSVIADTYFNKDTLTDAITMECVIYFLFLHMELEGEYTKAQLVAQKAETMLMQIKPHFVNNTLSTIQALCDIDPPLASRTIGNFARYLRMNLTVMDKPLPIPFKEELEHTKTYLEIETLRFTWIEAEYDIEDEEFCLPALTIQPLVENAIQHGLRKQKHGKVLIRTRKTEQGHLVEIIDNGSGFDEKNPVTKEGHGVGVRNVKYRVEAVSHGKLTMKSNEGKGTTVTILIP